MFLFLGLTAGLYFAVRAAGLPLRPLHVLLVVILAQGSIGFVQYATDVPIVLVGFHMLGAAFVSASVTWVLLSVREVVPAGSRASGDLATVSAPQTVAKSPSPRVGPGQR